MLFKLSIKNMKKSFKDYAIYFITLVLGVAIFYMFNSLDSQESMLQVSKSTKQIIKLMIEMLSMVSVFVAVILGLLIVYANNFLINRRKKEFGIYMTLGMSKRQISKIIFLETIFVGIISLVVGLVCGVFISQFMSILVGKLFQARMRRERQTSREIYQRFGIQQGILQSGRFVRQCVLRNARFVRVCGVRRA